MSDASLVAMNIPLEVAKLRTRMFRRRISEAQQERFYASDWTIEEAPKHEVNERLTELLSTGHIVTTGWMATSIRGYHTHYIVWRPKAS